MFKLILLTIIAAIYCLATSALTRFSYGYYWNDNETVNWTTQPYDSIDDIGRKYRLCSSIGEYYIPRSYCRSVVLSELYAIIAPNAQALELKLDVISNIVLATRSPYWSAVNMYFTTIPNNAMNVSDALYAYYNYWNTTTHFLIRFDSPKVYYMTFDNEITYTDVVKNYTTIVENGQVAGKNIITNAYIVAFASADSNTTYKFNAVFTAKST